jgi:hypothetical protein
MNRLLTILVIFVVGGSYLKEKINTKLHELDIGGKTNIVQQTQALITPTISSGVYGYDKNGLFHFNWGWSGDSNGYFELSVLNPNSLGLSGGTSGGLNN